MDEFNLFNILRLDSDNVLFWVVDDGFVARQSLSGPKFLLTEFARALGSLAVPVFRGHVVVKVVGIT